MAELLAAEILYALASAGTYVSLGAQTAIIVGSYVVVAGTTYAVAQSMIKAPAFGSLQSEASGKISMTRETVASRRVIYGTAKVSGPILYASTNSSNFSGKNEFLHIIVGLAGHQVTDVKNIYFNDVVAFTSGSGQNYAAFPADKLAVAYKYGASSQDAYVMTPATEWTTDHKLNGIASVYVKLVADPSVYPNGIPNITAVVVGHTLQDENGNDVNYQDNPALILRHYLLNYFGATSDEIDSVSFGVAKDACNYPPYGTGTGKRYTCNYTFTLNTKPADVIEDILKTCYGKLIYTNGKFTLKVGVYNTPTVYLNEDDIIGNIDVTTKSSLANSFNSVRGLYIDGSSYTSSFQASDFVPVTSSFYLAEDGGVESQIDIELSGVTDHTIARRVAKLTLLDSRQDLSVAFTTKISGLQLLAGDNVYLSLARYGWVNKVFEVIELGINADLSINLVLKETNSAIYDFPVGEDVDRDLSPNTNLPNPFIVAPPVGFSLLETTTKDKDGTIFPSATLYWSASYSGSISDIQVDFKDTASIDYSAIGTFDRTVSQFTTIDVETGKTYIFRARNFNYLGVFSPYVSSSIKILGNTTAPFPPANPAILGATASLYLTWENDPRDTDYKSTRVYLGTGSNFAASVDQGTVSGTSWNKSLAGEKYYWAWLQNINTSQITSSIVSAGASVYVHAFDFTSSLSGSAGPSGSQGNTVYNIYKRSAIVPATPTGNLTPVGWTITIPSDDGNALWVSSGLISGADGITLIGTWSSPQRLNGKASYYSDDAPISGSNASPVQGDLWFDTNDAFKVYRWSGTAWVSVQDGNIAPLSSSLQQNITNTTNYSASLAGTITNSSASLASTIVANSSSFTTSLNQTNSTVNSNSSSLAASITSVGAAVTTNSSSFAITITSLDSKVNTNSSSLASSITTTNGSITTTSSSLALSITNLTSTVTTNSSSLASSITTTNNTVTTNSSSAAISITNLDSRITNTSSSLASSITTTNGTVTTNSSSLALSITNLSSTVTNNSSSFASSLTTTNNTVATNSGSAATSITNLSSTVTSNSSSLAASVTTTASTVATLSGSIAGEYVLAVTAGNRVAGFKVLSSLASSSFDVQADKFRIYNSTNGTVTQSFLADASGVFIDTATIRSLDAGKIAAGTITAAISIQSPTITGNGIYISSPIGIRGLNDSQIITITGGDDNGVQNGAQLDISGTSHSSKGAAVLQAGYLATYTATEGKLILRTGKAGTTSGADFGYDNFTMYNSGNINIRKGISFNSTTSTDSLSTMAISNNFDNNNCLAYSGGSGFTGVLTTNEAHRWVNAGNSQELMALTTGGTLYVQTDVYADAFNSPSSIKYKENIQSLNGAIDVINALQPCKFDWKDGSKKSDVGLIAEQVADIIPNIVSYNDGEVSGLDYAKLTPFLISAIQEQNKLIENMRVRLALLEKI